MTDPDMPPARGRALPGRAVRGRWFRGWRLAAAGGGAAAVAAALAGGAVAVLAAGGAGPLAVGFVSSAGTVPADGMAIVVIPVGASAPDRVVIDGIDLRGGGGYSPPRVLALTGVTGGACAGIWTPVTGPGGFAEHCAPGGMAPLLGKLLPGSTRAAGTALTGTDQAAHAAPAGVGTPAAGDPAARAIGVAIEVGPPTGDAGCWGIGRVLVRYHAGGRNYVNSAAESLSGCTSE